MALNVISNFAANIAHRNLRNSDAQATSSLNKLSSGSRVVSAKDDAASQAIGSALRAEVMAMEQATVNARQAGSLLQIADGAMANVTDILVRAKMLAVQASSGQFSRNERLMFDNEYQSLKSEIDRIAITTKFAGNLLVNGTVEVKKQTNGVNYTNDDPNYANRVSAAKGFQDVQFEEDVQSSVFRTAYNEVTRGLTLTSLDSGTSQTVVLANRSIVEGSPEIVKFSQLGITVTLNQLFKKTDSGFPAKTGFSASADGGVRVMGTGTIPVPSAVVPTSGTKTAIVYHPRHGLKAGDTVTLTGSTDAAIVAGGVTLSGSYTVKTVASDGNSYTFEAKENFTSGAPAGEAANAVKFTYETPLAGFDHQNRHIPPSSDGDDVKVIQTAAESEGINLIAAGPAFSRLPSALRLQSLKDPGGFFIFGTDIKGEQTIDNAFAATAGSSTVTVTHKNHGLATGAKMTLKSPVVIGNRNVVLNPGEYTVTVTGANTYTVTASAYGNVAEVDTYSMAGLLAANDDLISFTDGTTTLTVKKAAATNASLTPPEAADLATGLAKLAELINASSSFNSSVVAAVSGSNLILTAKVAGTAISGSFAANKTVSGTSGSVARTDTTANATNVAGNVAAGTSSGKATIDYSVNLTKDVLTSIRSYTSDPANPVYANIDAVITDKNASSTGIASRAPKIFGTLNRDGNVYTAELRDMTISSEADRNLVCKIRFSSNAEASTLEDKDYGLIDLRTLSQCIGANNLTAKDTKSFDFKLGTAARDTDVLRFDVDSITTSALLLKGTNIASGDEAKAASAGITDAILRLSTIRANIGASQNRLEFASVNLATSIENTEAARSDLLDLDVAREMTNFTSKQILMQAGIAMLAQANQMPQNLLRLFQG
jgi:flagellin